MKYAYAIVLSISTLILQAQTGQKPLQITGGYTPHAAARTAPVTPPGESSPSGHEVVRFKGHAIGETAEQFYSAAMTEEKGLAKDWCSTLLTNPEAARKIILDTSSEESRRILLKDPYILRMSMDGSECQKVMRALQGMDVQVGNAYAIELGAGHVEFHQGKLVSMIFTVDSNYNDVATDMTKKLGAPSKQGYATYQNGFGATSQYGEATWTLPNIHASVTESPYANRRGIHDTVVLVSDAQWQHDSMVQREATRPNTLDGAPTQFRKPTASIPAQEEMREALKANSEAAKTSPAAAAAMAIDGKQLKPQELAELQKQGLASRCAIVTSPVGAEVFIDGNRAGISPLVLVLIKRDHPRVITIKMDGYQEVERQVVPDGTIIPIAVQLKSTSDLSSKGR